MVVCGVVFRFFFCKVRLVCQWGGLGDNIVGMTRRHASRCARLGQLAERGSTQSPGSATLMPPIMVLAVWSAVRSPLCVSGVASLMRRVAAMGA